MKKILVFSVVAISISFLLLSCSGNGVDERCGEAWDPSSELNDELNAVVDAATLFGQDPSKENCEAYKAAYQDYLDELNEWKDCYYNAGLEAQFNQSLSDAQDDLNAINCE